MCELEVWGINLEGFSYGFYRRSTLVLSYGVRFMSVIGVPPLFSVVVVCTIVRLYGDLNGEKSIIVA